MPLKGKFYPVVLASLIVCVLSASSKNGAEPILAKDLLKLKAISQVDVSPDGSKVVFVLISMGMDEGDNANDRDRHRYYRHLWMIDLDGTMSPIQLTYGDRSDNSPLWSPDGSQIAFLREHKKRPQVWILPLKGGEAYRITDAEFGASNPKWSPDGQKILFASMIPDWAVEGEPVWPQERPGREFRDAPNWKKIEQRKKTENIGEQEKAQRINSEETADKKTKDESESTVIAKPDGNIEEIRAWLAKNSSRNDPRVFDRLNLQAERSLQTQISYSHLFVADAKPEAEEVQLTHGFQSFRGADWSPDGTKIVCSSVKHERHPDWNLDSDLWILNADGSDPKRLVDWEHYRIMAPVFSPDGQTILFMTQDRREPGHSLRQLATVGVDGGEPRPLTFDFDRSIGRYAWSTDGKFIYFVSPDQGAFPLFRIPSDGGPFEKLIGGPLGVSDFDCEGDKLVYALTEVMNPMELYLADKNGKGSRQLTFFNAEWIADKRIVFPEERWIVRPDGFKVQYWIMEPADRHPGKKYPLMLAIHGGPSAMWGPGEFTMWHEFQLFAGRGYGIVYCNPRGSGGYGFDFKKANYRNWGVGPASDILAVCDEAAKLDWVDSNRQVVTGGSYAGYMTAWIVSQDHRFKAAVAQRGVYELSVFFGEGRAWRLVPNHYGGYPWEEEARKFLDANSPQTFVANIKTPLLIIHSDEDYRTGLIQSEYLYKSLKILGRPVEYVRYPGEGHELSRSGNPKRRMDRLNRIYEFFERFITHPQ
ncbi:MAG: S9 family peptidase [Candidatus Aminicenantes bacterium]|jgi:dipeptidyl aminopeptidase/acylaminoacyl peptidase